MILYFHNGKGTEREIGKPNSQESAHRIINEFLKEKKYKSYYTRFYQEGDTPMKKKDTKVRYVFDVGSHSEFFILEMETEAEARAIKKETGV